MKTSQEGIDLIKKFEGLSLTTYKCSAGIDTIGYGHTGIDVTPNKTITEFDAEALLRTDLEKFEKCVNDYVTAPIKQNQFDALVSLCYNIGCGAFTNSTLLKLLNTKSYQSAALQFTRWDKINGVENKGLLKRRILEQELFTR